MIALGVRNNNPANLQADHLVWIGQMPAPGMEAKFETLAEGIRAYVKVCYAYQLRLWNTPRVFLEHFAPSPDNPTAQYLANLCAWTGFAPDQALDFHDLATMRTWARAQFRQELGEEGAAGITDDQIAAGIALANGED